MTMWNLIVDVEQCHNCNNCFLACKDEYTDNTHSGYSAPQPLHGHKWINILSKERGAYPVVDTVYVPTMCNHCDDAPCIAAGDGAVKKRDDGIVIIDPGLAKGKREIVEACPYGAVWWNDALELPQHWTFDAHLLDRGWKEPRCVQSCPTGALRSIKTSDAEMAKIIDAENLEPLVADYETKPRVHYRNLHRYSLCFLAGGLVAKKDDALDCVSGAIVELLKDGALIASTESDAFGEFKFDSLGQSGSYDVRVTSGNFEERTISAEIGDESVVLGEIELQAI